MRENRMLTTHRHDDVLELVLDSPPVNALGTALRQALFQAIEAAEADASVKAIVVRGGGKMFSAGADITEFEGGMGDPKLPELLDRVEACTKPVIAAIHGTCFGGGFETTLACHYRVAAPSAKFGLPEVKLGLLPGAGGTQRLPRLAGALAALQAIVSGDPFSVAQAEKMGILDKLAGEDSLAADAIAFARTAPGPRRASEMTAQAEPGLFDKFTAENARKIKGLDAPAACIEAVKAATEVPFREGLALEEKLFYKLMTGEQSAALRHVFFAERAAAKIAGLPKDTAPRSIRRVGVIGAGTMGGGISMNFLSSGLAVTIVEMAQDALDRGVSLMRKNYEASAAKGRLTTDQVERAMGLLTPTLDFNQLAECDLIIEAVYENMDVKQQIFARLDGIAKPGAMLASNTSFLSIDTIAESTKRPADVLGMHFFSPANVMKLVEVVRGKETAPDALATAMELARRIRKVPVVSGVCYGFIGNRMLMPRQDQALALLLEGAAPEQIDRVHTAFGKAHGPLPDGRSGRSRYRLASRSEPYRIDTGKRSCAKGRWGQKTKAGYYDYDDQRKPTPSPVTTEIVEQFRAQQGITPRAGLRRRDHRPHALQHWSTKARRSSRKASPQRASDVDVVWLFGYGWPAARGGPMYWADTVGLSKMVSSLDAYAEQMGSRKRRLETAPRARRDRSQARPLNSPSGVTAHSACHFRASTLLSAAKAHHSGHRLSHRGNHNRHLLRPEPIPK